MWGDIHKKKDNNVIRSLQNHSKIIRVHERRKYILMIKSKSYTKTERLFQCLLKETS